MEQTFGSFVREKRMARGLSLRGLAAKLEVSPVYMSNMENNRRPAPTKEKLDHLIEILGLGQEDTERLLDLAARSKRLQVSRGFAGVHHAAGYCPGRPADGQGSGRHRRGVAGVYRPHHPAGKTG